jgi:hypothetical protein
MEETTMSLIDRYVYEVGRHLPRKNRSDIQEELRSALVDTLEDRVDGEPTEQDIIILLQEYGPPKKVAASYFPESQYLIGPTLFPLFRLVVGIALAAVVGSQLLAWAVAYFIAQAPFSPLEALGGLFNSIPLTFGSVVLVFFILQRFDVRPEIEEDPWDPSSLPHIGDTQSINRGERIFGVVVSVILLAVLLSFGDRIGFVTFPGGNFFGNPVIPQYLGWIILALLLGIAVDIYLLWQGRWSTSSRIAKIAANLVTILILFLLVQGHTAWLAERGAAGLFSGFDRIAEDPSTGTHLIGMQAFRLAFGVALIVTIVDTLTMLYRMATASLRSDLSPLNIPARKV